MNRLQRQLAAEPSTAPLPLGMRSFALPATAEGSGLDGLKTLRFRDLGV